MNLKLPDFMLSLNFDKYPLILLFKPAFNKTLTNLSTHYVRYIQYKCIALYELYIHISCMMYVCVDILKLLFTYNNEELDKSTYPSVTGLVVCMYVWLINWSGSY
jgi:hypothetical protein